MKFSIRVDKSVIASYYHGIVGLLPESEREDGQQPPCKYPHEIWGTQFGWDTETGGNGGDIT